MSLYNSSHALDEYTTFFNQTNSYYLTQNTLLTQMNSSRTPAYIFGQEVVKPIFDNLASLYNSVRTLAVNIYKADLGISSITQTGLVPESLHDEETHSHKSENFAEDEMNLEPSAENQYLNFNISFFERITHDQLLQQFENLGKLGDGAYALVYKVKHKVSGKKYAMTLRYFCHRQANDRREQFFHQMLKMQRTNPHVAKIFAVFWLKVKSTPFPEPGATDFRASYAHGQFVDTKHEANPEAQTYYREVIIKELGESSLATIKFAELKLNKMDLQIQKYYNYHQLALNQIVGDDMSPHNYVWIKTENMEFNGKSLKQVEYFCYTYKNHFLYVPTPVVVKSVGYSGWETFSHFGEDYDNNWLGPLLTNNRLTLKQLFKRYPKPNVPENKILYLNSPSIKQGNEA